MVVSATFDTDAAADDGHKIEMKTPPTPLGVEPHFASTRISAVLLKTLYGH